MSNILGSVQYARTQGRQDCLTEQGMAGVQNLFTLLNHQQTGQTQSYPNGIIAATLELLADNFIAPNCPLLGSVADGCTWPARAGNLCKYDTISKPLPALRELQFLAVSCWV